MATNETEPRTELGRQLEKERENRGLTKEEFIKLFPISKPAYIKWLTTATDIAYVNVQAIATVLGVGIGQVRAWMDEDRAKGRYLSSISRPLEDLLKVA